MLDSTLISKAEEAERRYDYLEAARLYSEYLPPMAAEGQPRSIARNLGNIERAAYCYMRAAFQAGARSNFVSTLDRAAELYESLIRISEQPDSDSDELLRSRRVLYLSSKLEFLRALQIDDPDLRQEKIHASTALAEECLFGFNRKSFPILNPVLREASAVEDVEVGKYANHLLGCYSEEIVAEFSKVRCEEIIQKALTCAEESVRIFSFLIADARPIEDEQIKARHEYLKKELTRAYLSLSWFCHLGEVIFDSAERRDELSRRKRECWSASELLLTDCDDSLLKLEDQLYSYHRSTYRLKRMEEVARRLLPELRKSGDNVAIAGACGALCFAIRWRMFEQDRPQEIMAMLQEIRKLFAELDRRYGLATPVGVHWSWVVIYHWMLISALLIASGFEKESNKKKSLLNEALEAAKRARSRYRSYSRVRYMDLAIAQSARMLAETESGGQQETEISRSLLRQSLSAIRSGIRICDEVEPYYAWDQGAFLTELASIAFKLSSLEEDKAEKEKLLDEAVNASTRSLALMPRMNPEQEFGSSATLRIASSFELHSSVLMSLYEIKGERELLHKRLSGLEEAKKIYENADLPSRTAETLWEIAVTNSMLLDHAKASLYCELASKSFELAAQRVPAFSAYYQDYSRYMIAWSKIEKARASHENERYRDASTFYHDASKLLSMTHSWAYLSAYYLAFSKLEVAEEYSMLSQEDKATDAFGEAELAFEALRSEQTKVVANDLKEKGHPESASLSRYVLMKAKYCAARKLMEEGRHAHKWGDLSQSTAKYLKSIETLKRLKEDWGGANNEARKGSDGKEIDAMVDSCIAWQKMEEAELANSAQLFDEAATLFTRAKGSATRQKGSLLCRANENYCRAMALGLKFKESLNLEDYRKTKSYLVEASNCYASAGVLQASDWLTATERMLDAYAYIARAPAEMDPEARARNYFVAGEILKQSAEVFERSGYRGRKNEVLVALDKVEGEKNFALSLVAMVSKPNVALNIPTFPPPSLSNEPAAVLAGLKRTNVQVSFSLEDNQRAQGFTLASELKLRVLVNIINTGKEPATVHRIEGLIPHGTAFFDLNDDRESDKTFSIEQGGSMDFEGKRLVPLEMDRFSYTIALKEPQDEIKFTPKVYYSDQGGKLWSTEAGSQKLLIPGSINELFNFRLQFKNKKATELLDYLIDAFRSDHAIQKLHEEKSGWRTMSQISKDIGISSSTAYGKVKGGMGTVFLELKEHGLIEIRSFPGERGRGGVVTRIRIAYQKNQISRLLR